MRIQHSLIIAGVIAVVSVSFISCEILPPTLTIELLAPGLQSDEAWLKSIKENPSSNGHSGYEILSERGSRIAIDTALRDVNSADSYVWLNAANYLAEMGDSRSVPYLIKSLRHTARRGDAERVRLLQKLTKLDIGNDYTKWHKWYIDQPNSLALNWESNLGRQPRIPNASLQGDPPEPASSARSSLSLDGRLHKNH